MVVNQAGTLWGVLHKGAIWLHADHWWSHVMKSQHEGSPCPPPPPWCSDHINLVLKLIRYSEYMI